MFDKNKIKAKAVMGLPLTSEERGIYLLTIATKDEMQDFLRKEKEGKAEV